NDRAAQVVADLPPSLDRKQLPLALARCYEALGWNGRALEQYGAALQARPDDFVVLRKAAGYYLSLGNRKLAEPLLRKLLDSRVAAPEEDIGWARKQLAVN